MKVLFAKFSKIQVLGVLLFTFTLTNATDIIMAQSGTKDSPSAEKESMDHSGHEMPNANMSVDQKLSSKNSAKPVYTCPMHPQIRQPNPGRCPICGMELVSAESESDGGEDTSSVKISPVARRVAGIKTVMVEPKSVSKRVKAVGNISFDESRLATIPAYVEGRIEKLYADYTGVAVKKGEHLAVIYSPDLYTAQVEYLQSRKSVRKMSQSSLGSVLKTQQALLANAKTKLVELGMSEDQISNLRKTGKAESRLEIYSPITGTVIEKPAAQGQYVKSGQVIFKIADLSTVWLMIDVFPQDANFIRYGQKVEATVRSVPGKTFTGRVAFINPVVSPTTRTIGVRVELLNDTGNLRPGDYGEAEIVVPVSSTGQPAKIYDKSLAGKYISPMHPQIVRDKPGKCPICGMKLIEAKNYGFTDDPDDHEELIVVPRDAILRVGKNSVVFIEETKGEFTLRQIKTGPSVGDLIVVLEGLEEYDTIAAEGVYLLDSQLQLSGKTSLIDIAPDGSVKDSKPNSGEHQHNH